MKTTVSAGRFSGLNLRVSPITVAAISAAAFFTAILWQFEIFAYICAVISLAAVHTSTKKGGDK